MRRRLRTLAAVVAGLAMVAAVPAPCGCAPESAPGHPGEHACCTPPAGVSAADRGCCDEVPDLAEALASPSTPAETGPVAFVTLPFPAPAGHPALARTAASPVSPSPPSVLRI